MSKRSIRLSHRFFRRNRRNPSHPARHRGANDEGNKPSL